MEGTKFRQHEHKSAGVSRVYLIFLPILFFTKRLVFISFLIVANDYLWFQIATLNFLALLSIIYMLWFKPMESLQANLIEVFNDYTLLVLTYFLWCFTDIVGEAETRYELGYIFIAVVLGNVACHLLLMVKSSLIDFKIRCQRCRARKKAKE